MTVAHRFNKYECIHYILMILMVYQCPISYCRWSKYCILERVIFTGVVFRVEL